MFDARLLIVQAATDVVLRRLDGLPSSAKTEQLRVLLGECLRHAERWSASPPTPREQDALMKRILTLHVEVTRLERNALLGAVETSLPAGPHRGKPLNGRPEADSLR
jgi:hypothetical protein